ncbi:hypothetical protein F4780DRAFT_775430 [Xylariomycetidae sp. FL0641]|nr:hypothetical protein F4780DRAFT_775430 [Xylariomycetidae sp. FL0641]
MGEARRLHALVGWSATAFTARYDEEDGSQRQIVTGAHRAKLAGAQFRFLTTFLSMAKEAEYRLAVNNARSLKVCTVKLLKVNACPNGNAAASS